MTSSFIERTDMTRPRPLRVWIGATLAVLVCLTIAFFTTPSSSYLRKGAEQPYELWMAALKGFDGPVYYVGSEGDYSYFRVGKYFPSRYKARTAKILLPQTFALGKETPYLVTAEMVSPY